MASQSQFYWKSNLRHALLGILRNPEEADTEFRMELKKRSHPSCKMTGALQRSLPESLAPHM